MKVEISTGELIDKISILEIKLLNIKDSSKIINVYKELQILNTHFQELLDEYGSKIKELYIKISSINKTLWDIEENIRKKESLKEAVRSFELLFKNIAFSLACSAIVLS